MCCMAWLSASIWPEMLRQLFHAADLDEAAEQFGAKTLAVPCVADEHGEFRLVRAVLLAQAADAKDFFLLALGGP